MVAMTMVTVSRGEEDFIRSGLDEVDEVEIFEGTKNTLTMEQTYAWEFQCKYELQHYPFDTQVHQEKNCSPAFSLLFQECKIEMTVMKSAKETVQLMPLVMADQVTVFLWSRTKC